MWGSTPHMVATLQMNCSHKSGTVSRARIIIMYMQIAKHNRKSVLTKLLSMALLLTMACFASCSNEDDVVGPDQPATTDNKPISFSGSMLKEQAVTRASGLEETQTSFTVYGFKNDAFDSSSGSYTSYQTVFPGFTVNWTSNSAYTTTSNTSDWEYVGISSDQTIKYWDFGANAYRFFGYSLGKATADPATSIVPVTANANSTPVTLSATVDASSDATIAAAPFFTRLWFSTGNTTLYPDKQFGNPVILEFLKPFARVRVMFTFAEGVQMEHSSLSDISFKPTDATKRIPQKGTVTATYPLSGTETTESISAVPNGYLTAITQDYWEGTDSDPAHLTWYTVLPATQDTYTMSVNVDGETKTTYVPGEYMDWKAGYEYTYKFKILDGGGLVFDEVQVGIKNWEEAGTDSHPVYNW